MSRRGPLFLARRSYRRRRMMDAVFFLPIAGAVLWMLPAFWDAHDPSEDVASSAAALFVFAVWAVLIVVSALLARGLLPALSEEDQPEGGQTEKEDAP